MTSDAKMTSPRELEKNTEILAEVSRQLNRAIPTNFGLRIKFEPLNKLGITRGDVRMSIKLANEQTLSYVADIKKTVDRSGLLKIIGQLEKIKSEQLEPIVLARYISLPAQEELKRLSIAFADATGNVFMTAPDQGLWLSNRGLDKDPWRKAGRPKFSLSATSTQLIVKALLDIREPYTTSELIKKSGAPRGTGYWVLDMLEEYSYVIRDSKNLIKKINWPELAKAWADETDFFKSNAVYSFVAPRGMHRLIDDLKLVDPNLYACSGTLAASAFKSSAGLYTAMIYTTNVAELAAKLGIRETERGANVLLAYPESDGPFQRTGSWNGVRIVSAAQIYRDLTSGPGRNPEEAKKMFDWMVRHAELWRKEV